MTAFLILCAVLWLAALAVIWITCAAESPPEPVDLLIGDDDWALDYHLAAQEAAWLRLLAAVEDPFYSTRAEIAALPETRTR